MSPQRVATPELRCSGCDGQLARSEDTLEVDGRSEASFQNPAGNRYRLRFVGRAAGCVAGGEASHEASWFSGYTWQRTFCRGCSAHVGWLFRSRSREFFGLIVEAHHASHEQST